MKVCVTGGRNYRNRDRVFRALDRAHDAHGIDVLVHGACETGADHFADEWATINRVPVLSFAADWGPDPSRPDKSAGPKRNSLMLKEGAPDKLIAFSGGPGTADCVKKARRLGIPVQEEL